MGQVVTLLMRFVLITTISTQAYFISSDNLDNLYVITKDNTLVKYDSTGTKLFSYNTQKYGQLTYVDATNPMKILAYYSDFTTGVLLDNTLSELSVINFKQAGILQPACVCLASDNNIWVFDATDFKLKKLDQNLNLLFESTDMVTASGEAPVPNFMIERDNNVYMVDPEKGVFIFDNYGTYSHMIHIKGLNDLQEFNHKLFYFKNDSISSYDMRTLETQSTPVSDSAGVKQGRIEKNRLFLLKENAVALYRY